MLVGACEAICGISCSFGSPRLRGGPLQKFHYAVLGLVAKCQTGNDVFLGAQDMNKSLNRYHRSLFVTNVYS